MLVNGKIEGTQDANTRFLTNCIDPLCDQIQEEITRKRYGYNAWKAGDYVRMDSASILHFDMFANAANVEKLVARPPSPSTISCGPPVSPPLTSPGPTPTS